jgi:hypothetical protein
MVREKRESQDSSNRERNLSLTLIPITKMVNLSINEFNSVKGASLRCFFTFKLPKNISKLGKNFCLDFCVVFF